MTANPVSKRAMCRGESKVLGVFGGQEVGGSLGSGWLRRGRVLERSLTASTVVVGLHGLSMMLVGANTRTLKLKTELCRSHRKSSFSATAIRVAKYDVHKSEGLDLSGPTPPPYGLWLAPEAENYSQ